MIDWETVWVVGGIVVGFGVLLVPLIKKALDKKLTIDDVLNLLADPRFQKEVKDAIVEIGELLDEKDE